LASALAVRWARAVDVPLVEVADLAAVRAVTHPSPLLCMALPRHGLGPLRAYAGPALVVGPRCDAAPTVDVGPVLVGLDGSPRAEAALGPAAAWAGVLGLDVWLLYALSLADTAALRPSSGPADVLQNSYLSRTVAGLGGAGAVAGWEVLHGAPAAALVDHARHTGAHVLVLNSHGAATADRALLGRVPRRVLAESPVPVLLTRATEALPRPPPPPPPPRPVIATAKVVRLSRAGPGGVAVAARSYIAATPPRSLSTARPPRSRPGRRFVAAVAVAILTLGTFCLRVPVSYYRLGGATRPARGLFSITGAPVDPSAGRILITVVTTEPVTFAGVVGAWLGRSGDVHPNPNGLSADDMRWTNRHLMEEAGITATAVALRQLRLDPAVVRVAVVPHGLGGPSAGLALALELVDLLSPGDLTHGHLVAVSGALDPSGVVEPVGGIAYKAAAARRAGADVLLVPPAVVGEASLYAGGVRVVPVRSFAEALATLRSL
jgi:PDZ domain-containing protein